MLIIWGLRVVHHTITQGVFFCRNCGGDRNYRKRAGRRYITLFFIPVVPLSRTSVHVQCVTCKTRYVTEVLKLPTAEQMQAALPAGARALVSVMLRAGDPGCPAARRRAIEMAAAAGAQGYDDTALDADLAEPAAAGQRPIAVLGGQLKPEAREWYLAELVRIALADGPLTGAERAAAELVAAELGMTQAQAYGVIMMTEQAANQD
jgi:zinc-ribbon family/Tellurite resistance protein TerB